MCSVCKGWLYLSIREESICLFTNLYLKKSWCPLKFVDTKVVRFILTKREIKLQNKSRFAVQFLDIIITVTANKFVVCFFAVRN